MQLHDGRHTDIGWGAKKLDFGWKIFLEKKIFCSWKFLENFQVEVTSSRKFSILNRSCYLFCLSFRWNVVYRSSTLCRAPVRFTGQQEPMLRVELSHSVVINVIFFKTRFLHHCRNHCVDFLKLEDVVAFTRVNEIAFYRVEKRVLNLPPWFGFWQPQGATHFFREESGK